MFFADKSNLFKDKSRFIVLQDKWWMPLLGNRAEDFWMTSRKQLAIDLSHRNSLDEY
jgi:hypothetical protein